MKAAYIFLMGVCFGAAGVLAIPDIQAKAGQCERNTENAVRYAAAVAEVLNGGEIQTNDVAAKCRVRSKPHG